jgi:hypothetical protein
MLKWEINWDPRLDYPEIHITADKNRIKDIPDPTFEINSVTSSDLSNYEEPESAGNFVIYLADDEGFLYGRMTDGHFELFTSHPLNYDEYPEPTPNWSDFIDELHLIINRGNLNLAQIKQESARRQLLNRQQYQFSQMADSFFYKEGVTSCCICTHLFLSSKLTGSKIVMTPCCHFFHEQCLKAWVGVMDHGERGRYANPVCPLDRSNIEKVEEWITIPLKDLSEAVLNDYNKKCRLSRTKSAKENVHKICKNLDQTKE